MANGTLVWAHLETPNFTFDAFAESRTGALMVLVDAWSRHAKATGADRTYLAKNQDEITYTEVKAGTVLRDREKV